MEHCCQEPLMDQQRSYLSQLEKTKEKDLRSQQWPSNILSSQSSSGVLLFFNSSTFPCFNLIYSNRWRFNNACLSYPPLRHNSQHLHGGSQPTVAPVPWDPSVLLQFSWDVGPPIQNPHVKFYISNLMVFGDAVFVVQLSLDEVIRVTSPWWHYYSYKRGKRQETSPLSPCESTGKRWEKEECPH